MSLGEVVSKSLKETLSLKRVLPFFLLYSIFSTCSLILFMPILSVSPYLFSLKYSSNHLAVVAINLLAIFIVFLLVVLVDLWFSGALIFDVWKKKGFDKGLEYSKKRYPNLLALGIIFAIFGAILYFLGEIGSLVQLLITWLFIFALPAIIVKKDSFDLAIARSFHVVKKNFLRTFVFFLLIVAFTYFFIFASAFLSFFFAAPIISKFVYLLRVISTTSYSISQPELIQMVGLLMENYSFFFVIGFIISLFYAFSRVFALTAETYYFLELTKKKLMYF